MKQNDKLQKVMEELEQGVNDFFTSEKFIRYLNVMSRFHTYSLNNQILIAMQNPEATRVAGFSSWMNNFKRYVRRGEKAITILAPFKRMVEVETDQADEYGNAVTKKQELISFRPVSVFDVSQTEGEPLPELVSELTGEVAGYDSLFAAIRAVAPFHIDIRRVDSEAKGWCDYTSEVIVIKEGMSQVQNIKTAIHETAHGRIHSVKDGKSRSQKEVEAESIAYVVSNHFGIDTSDYSFAYVAGWAGEQEKEVLKSCMKTIQSEAKEMIEAIEMELEEPGQYLKKEQKKKLQEAVQEKMEREGIKGEAAIVGAEQSRITALAVYEDDMPAHVLKEKLDEAWLTGTDRETAGLTEHTTFSVVPVNLKTEQPDKTLPDKNMTDMSWPMVTILANHNVPRLWQGRHMTIHEALTNLRIAENALKLSGEQGSIKLAVEFTYLGQSYKINDSFTVGAGKQNFIDYLDIPSDICTYLKRHVQIMDVCEKCRNENAVGKLGHSRQNKYEDMIYEWAEEMRLQLNYKQNPDIRKPPEYNPEITLQYENWRWRDECREL